MDSDTGAFPPYPIRGVRAVYARQAGCPSAFAEVTVDFEPRVEGVVFEVAADMTVDGDDDPEWQAECRAAVEAGVRDELALSGTGLPPAAVVVLRRMRFHPVDSHPPAFRQVGRLAVRNALASERGQPTPAVVADRDAGPAGRPLPVRPRPGGDPRASPQAGQATQEAEQHRRR